MARRVTFACQHQGEVEAAPSPLYPASGKSPMRCIPCTWAEKGFSSLRDARYGPVKSGSLAHG